MEIAMETVGNVDCFWKACIIWFAVAEQASVIPLEGRLGEKVTFIIESPLLSIKKNYLKNLPTQSAACYCVYNNAFHFGLL